MQASALCAVVLGHGANKEEASPALAALVNQYAGLLAAQVGRVGLLYAVHPHQTMQAVSVCALGNGRQLPYHHATVSAESMLWVWACACTRLHFLGDLLSS